MTNADLLEFIDALRDWNARAWTPESKRAYVEYLNAKCDGHPVADFEPPPRLNSQRGT